jgi:hypothetical protein
MRLSSIAYKHIPRRQEQWRCIKAEYEPTLHCVRKIYETPVDIHTGISGIRFDTTKQSNGKRAKLIGQIII